MAQQIGNASCSLETVSTGMLLKKFILVKDAEKLQNVIQNSRTNQMKN